MPRALLESETTAMALACAFATYSVDSSALSARLSGLPPMSAFSVSLTLMRSISWSGSVSITETLSASEFTTKRREPLEFSIIAVGCRSTGMSAKG